MYFLYGQAPHLRKSPKLRIPYPAVNCGSGQDNTRKTANTRDILLKHANNADI